MFCVFSCSPSFLHRAVSLFIFWTHPLFLGPMKHPCKRCQINFATQRAYRVHVFESMDHHICQFCGYKKDLPTFKALQHHLDDEHLYCEPCHWFAPSGVGLRQHNISKHNMCAACGDFFVNPHELHGVRRIPFSFQRLLFCQHLHIVEAK